MVITELPKISQILDKEKFGNTFASMQSTRPKTGSHQENLTNVIKPTIPNPELSPTQ